MTVPSMESLGRRPSTAPASIAASVTVLLVTDDHRYGERVAARFRDDGDLEVRRASSLAAALRNVAEADCLVGDYEAVTGPDDGSLERVRERAPDLPVVLLTDESTERAAVVETVRSVRWTEWLERTDSSVGVDRLGHRIRTLVEQRRLAALAQRSLAGVELAGDAIGIVAPDGDLEFANRAFAMQFGYDAAALRGRSWKTLFTDDSVDRLETAAVPTVADGWRWTGTCTGRRKSGATVPVRVRLGGPDNGGLVFVVEPTGDGAATGADDASS